MARWGRERRRRGRTPCRRGFAALPWLSLSGAEAAVGLPPSLRPRPRQWHPFPGASLSSAPFQGFSAPLSGLAPPLAMLRRPLAGASLGRNAALLHGGRALPDFTKSPCFPKWRFYRPSLGTLESSIRQSPAFWGNRANPEKPEEPDNPRTPCSPYGSAIDAIFMPEVVATSGNHFRNLQSGNRLLSWGTARIRESRESRESRKTRKSR